MTFLLMAFGLYWCCVQAMRQWSWPWYLCGVLYALISVFGLWLLDNAYDGVRHALPFSELAVTTIVAVGVMYALLRIDENEEALLGWGLGFIGGFILLYYVVPLI